MNLYEAKQLAESLIAEHLDSSWTFAWNNRKRAFGVCDEGKRQILLSRIMTQGEDSDAVHQTILHEIAHARAGVAAKHGPVWKMIARSLGVRNPKASRQSTGTTKDDIVPAYVLVYGSEIINRYHRRPARSTFAKLAAGQIRGRPETKGQLQIMAFVEYQRMHAIV